MFEGEGLWHGCAPAIYVSQARGGSVGDPPDSGKQDSRCIDDLDRAGLGAAFAHLFCKTDPGADLQPVEVIVRHAVSVKVNLAVIKRLEETVALLSEQSDYESLRLLLRVGLHLSLLAPGELAEPAAGRLKGAPHHGRNSMVRVTFPSLRA